ncbi:MAG: cytochrome b N-terminal domain-containing protein [Tatlockia sp.]|nr:cytochrome b N-terminal domain-containing protein [Tatlockia sp.]
MKALINWIDARFPLLSTWKQQVSEYYVPKNLNFLYFFGSLSLVVLLMQFLTGFWLTMFYKASAAQAFDSIEYIMRDVNYGWLLRYMHTTGASAFFIIIYFHLFKAILYGSYQKPRELVWIFGVFLFFLLMAEAFCGYLLPWGQMSYWGAQVITSLFGAIPYIGDGLVIWLRGDYNVAEATLQRFFAFHVVAIPLLMLGMVFLHLVALRKVGSNNPEGIEINAHLNERGKPLDGLPFHPYFTVKDFFVILVFLFIFFVIVFFFPEMGGLFLEKDNFLPANPLITPEHIAPVWYMTPFYAILRAIPNKLLGVMAMSSAALIFLLMPWLDKSPARSMRYKGAFSRFALVVLVISFTGLGYLGMANITPFKQLLARIFTLLYFSYFFMMPIYTRYERSSSLPERINR